MAQLARPPCETRDCTSKAAARLGGKWLCSKHLKIASAPVPAAATRR